MLAVTQAAIKPGVSFEEYIDICARTDERYELVRGELVKSNPPTWQHNRIAKFLEKILDAEIEKAGYPWEAFRETGQRTEEDSSRLPDVTVVPVAAIAQFINQTAVLTVPAPLIVEIVSPGSVSEDYNSKLQEYQALGIPEYWIVDHEGLGAAQSIGFPKAPTITICQLVAATYQSQRFWGNDKLRSPTFPRLDLAANQVFAARTREAGAD
jgi:Uma2 family endonuclease